MDVQRRRESAADEPFLRRLIVDTIAQELGAAAWPEPVRSSVLDMQYASRRGARAGSHSEIVSVDGQDAGWIAIRETDHEIRLVEIMIAADFRGRGIGTRVIGEALDSARNSNKPLRLNVNVTNAPAIRLYERLGFLRIGGNEVQHLMEA